MAVEVGDIVRIACQFFANDADELVNVHTFIVDNLYSITNDTTFMTQLAGCLATELYSHWMSQCTNELQPGILTGINLTKDEVLPPVAWTAAGTVNTNEQLPLQTCALVFLNGVAPRRQGRVYLPAPDETLQQLGGDWVTGAQTALINFVGAIMAPLDDGDVSVERVIATATGASPILPTIGGFSAAARTQRRRTIGRGS